MALTTRRHFLQQTAITSAMLLARSVRALGPGHATASGDGALDLEAVKRLGSRLQGQLILPGALEYEGARQVFNRAFDRRPALIARCASESDVARVLEFARNLGLPLAVRGGGHSRAGFGVVDRGVVLDVSPMSRVEVQPDQRQAQVEGGSLVRDVDQATQRFGLATTMGGCPTVGVAGLTLGGGEGLLMSKLGAACDNLVAARLVTVDGSPVDASEGSNPDLFWAIRGGGGNFGVVTAMRFRLHRVVDVLAGTLTYPGGRITELLQAFAEFVERAPDEMNVVGVVSPSQRGPAFHMLVCHAGDPGRGNDLLRPLRALGPQADEIRVMPYLQAQTTINPYASVAHFQTDLFLPKLDRAAIGAISEALDGAPAGRRAFIVPLYGAVTRVGTNDTAFPLRQRGYEVDIMGRWDAPAEKAAAVHWVEALRDKLRPLARGVYSNQLGDTSEALAREAYAANYARLAKVKKRYDPDNVLQLNQNVKPG